MKKTTIRQSLEDTVSACTKLGVHVEIIARAKALLDSLDNNPIVENEIEKTFNRHQYRNLRYSRISTYEESPEALLVPLELSDKAARLLLILERVATRQEVQLSKKTIAKLLDVSDATAKRTLGELIEKGVLIEEIPARGSEAKIYKLNSCLFKVGKTRATPDDAKKLTFSVSEAESKAAAAAPTAEDVAAKEKWEQLKPAIQVASIDWGGRKHQYIRLSL